MRRLTLILLTALAVLAAAGQRREFRGAWLQTVYRDDYARRSTAANKAYLRAQLDSLQAAGINAVIFQVRPQADAFYASRLEPWSCYLCPGGKAPTPAWDPLQFVIDEAHARGMELHAWLNPYRITATRRQSVPAGHIARRHPERTVRYDGRLYFDPGQPANRDHIASVVRDIVTRYDVDGIHFDDYFYPYPVKGVRFDDRASFSRHGKGMKLADWRRRNVDLLIEQIHDVIAAAKPWVVFGVSPFGIWRNAATDPAGSPSSGLQNYDDLYADILMWARRGWIDYQLPQLYWPLDHKAAPSRLLLDWWADNACGRHMYIGQDIARTMEPAPGELHAKLALARRRPEVTGHCWWPGYDLT
ncbi:MAG: family 10 glycosylhydrolase, partial [Terasakiella sp.]|nr:family 10 glycosylhydrolase [Terasakiella sp.]